MKLLQIPNIEIRENLRNLYYRFFSIDCNISMLEINNCSSSFKALLNCIPHKHVTEMRQFCKSFQRLCISYQSDLLNHQVIHSLIFVVTLKTDILWSVISVECPIGKTYSNSKRCDVVLYHNGLLIIIEVKYKISAEKALEQIIKKDYLKIAMNKKIIKNRKELKYYVCLGIAVDERKVVTMKLKVLDEMKKEI